jgi:hypothetical protein
MAVEAVGAHKLLYARGGIAFWDVGGSSYQYQLIYYAPVPDETRERGAYDAFISLAWNVFSKGLANATNFASEGEDPLHHLVTYFQGFGMKLGRSLLYEPAEALRIAQSLHGPSMEKRREVFFLAHKLAVENREKGIHPRPAATSSRAAPPDEILKHAAELSASLQSREADVATWDKFLALQSESLAARVEEIMARARTDRNSAEETLNVFLAQNGISPQQLEEHHAAWRGSRGATHSPAWVATIRAQHSAAAAVAYSLQVMKQDWRSIAGHAPGLIAPPVLERALALADALLAAEARLTPWQRRPARRQHTIMRRWARWRRKMAVAGRDAAERNLYDYLEHSGMHDRMRLARDYLMEAWKRTLAEDIELDKAPAFLDVAGVLAARVRAYLDHWARECASKPELPM